MNVAEHITKSKRKKEKLFAVLIDPEKFNKDTVHAANLYKADFIFVGGSTVTKNEFDFAMRYLKRYSAIPVVIFPGDEEQVSRSADALLLLSLYSGRNADYLIGKHVKAAQTLKRSKIEIIPTGYLLIDSDGKNSSTTSKISETNGLPSSDKRIITSTAIAAELLGSKLIYLEAGSGSGQPVLSGVIKSVKKNINVPLIVGGGIDTPKKALAAWSAGADIVVAGNAIEKNINLIKEIISARDQKKS